MLRGQFYLHLTEAMNGTILTRILARLNAMAFPSATGQATKANSVPVVLASNDDLVAVTGATTDTAVTTDAAGTQSGKLRGLVKWAFERMPAALGQTTMAGSLPVAIASNQGSIPVVIKPATSGGPSVARSLDLQPTAFQVKGSGGQLYGWYISNSNSSSVRFVKIYDKATAATEADTPLLTIAIPPMSATNLSIPEGIPFTLGIQVRGTTGALDSDTGAPASNVLIANFLYA